MKEDVVSPLMGSLRDVCRDSRTALISFIHTRKHTSDKASNMDYHEDTPDLKEVTTDEEEFRHWEGIEEDWQEFNRKNNPELNKKGGGR